MEKPAIKTLKKTFTSMLSRIPFSRNHTDTSSISEYDSDESEMAIQSHEASTLDRSKYRKKQAKKMSGNLERARSETSVNKTHSGSFEIIVNLSSLLSFRRSQEENLHVFLF